MMMLRGTPSSYDSSQRTLLTPYGAGAGTPEEEEELALLEQLERMQQQRHPLSAEGTPRSPVPAENDPQQHAPAWQPDHSDEDAWAGEPAGSLAATLHQRPGLQPQEQADSSERHLGSPRQAPASGGEQARAPTNYAPWFRHQTGTGPGAASLHGSPVRTDSNATPLLNDGAHWRGAAARAGGLPLAAAPPLAQAQQHPADVPAERGMQNAAEGQGRVAASPPDAGPAQPLPEKTPPGRAEPPVTTTIRIGDYPPLHQVRSTDREVDEWNTAFRTTYGQFAVDAARKAGVPARLLAALSANEMAARNWGKFHSFADRNTLLTKSVGPLQIAYTTALKYGLVPVDNEFYNAKPEDVRVALHDPDVRYGRASEPSGLTPVQRLERRADPYPNNLNGRKIIHDYLDNPATGFEAGAKLLNIYLKKLTDDYQSGAYLGYSKDFRDLTGLSREASEIHRDLKILASGDREAIFHLRPSEPLAKALAMMWNNDVEIVNGSRYATTAPNASTHGKNMDFQHEHQDALIPAPDTDTSTSGTTAPRLPRLQPQP